MNRALSLMVVCSLVVMPAVAGAAESGLSRLRDGAASFRDGRFADALVSFRVAEHAPDVAAEAGWYLAATLTKLGRFDEAVERFERSEADAPGQGDAVLLFYRATALYEARLFVACETLLAALAPKVGPRLRAEVDALRSRMAPALHEAPTDASIDWYLARVGQARDDRRPRLARLCAAEALALERRRAAPYRLAEAEKAAALPPGTEAASR
jgi:tetratricopeptide (TPR) repeat protein